MEFTKKSSRSEKNADKNDGQGHFVVQYDALNSKRENQLNVITHLLKAFRLHILFLALPLIIISFHFLLG